MIEKVYAISKGEEKTVDEIIQDEDIHYLHMVFNRNQGLREHTTDSNVYITVLKGTASLGISGQERHEYSADSVLKIPYKTKMSVKNMGKDPLELIVIKAPAPKG